MLQNPGREKGVSQPREEIHHCILGDKFLLSHSTPVSSAAATGTAINSASGAVSLAQRKEVSGFIVHRAGSDILRAAAFLCYLFSGHLALKISSIKEDPSLPAANFLTVAALTKIQLNARGALHLWLDENPQREVLKPKVLPKFLHLSEKRSSFYRGI